MAEVIILYQGERVDCMTDVIVFEKFADFVIRKVNSRAKFVHRAINQSAYDPKQDYYLALRQRLISLLKKNTKLTALDELLKKVNPRRFDNYELLINRIQNFMQGKNYKWVTPPRSEVIYSNLALTVNPEIGLKGGDKIYFIKLYFKKTTLDTNKLDIMLKIMQDAFKDDSPNADFAVWDIRRENFYDKNALEEIKIPYDLEQEAIAWIKYATED